MNNHTFDVIVVGAGPAGATAALVLARQGIKVLMIERGEYPGSKNMFGGALFGEVLEELIPRYWEEAPLERYIGRKLISILTDDSALSIDINSSEFKGPPYHGFVVQRSIFDRWYAQEAVKAGAVLLTRTTVVDVLREGNQIVGVKVDRSPGEIKAKIVIAADGAVSLLAKKAGLRRDFKAEQFCVGVKEVLQLPPEALEKRFGLVGDEGLSNEYLGRMGEGLHGGGYLYTNKNSISLGVVIFAHSLKDRKETIYDAHEKFKRHPAVAPLIEGGRLLEYSAHIIPEAGVEMVPQLSCGGMMVTGDAAGLLLNAAVFLEGVNLGMASGKIAAETAIEALKKGKFGAQEMSEYDKKLQQSFVLKSLKRFKGARPMLLNERLYEVYPSFIMGTLEKWFRGEANGHPKLSKTVLSMLNKDLGMWQLVKDGIQAGRGLLL